MKGIKRLIRAYKIYKQGGCTFRELRYPRQVIRDDYIYEWFSQNYIPLKKQCKAILTLSIIEYSCTLEDIFEACIILRRGSAGKEVLTTTLRFLGYMAEGGEYGRIAGERLRAYFNTKV